MKWDIHCRHKGDAEETQALQRILIVVLSKRHGKLPRTPDNTCTLLLPDFSIDESPIKARLKGWSRLTESMEVERVSVSLPRLMVSVPEWPQSEQCIASMRTDWSVEFYGRFICEEVGLAAMTCCGWDWGVWFGEWGWWSEARLEKESRNETSMRVTCLCTTTYLRWSKIPSRFIETVKRLSNLRVVSDTKPRTCRFLQGFTSFNRLWIWSCYK